MADISAIVIPGGDSYNFKDLKAHYYGECSTAAATAAKEVSILHFTASDLVAGTTIRVKFTYHNTVASPTLNVNNLGAKSIYRYGTTAPSTSAATSWQAGSIVALTYDGTGWVINGWLNDNTTYSYYSNLGHANGNFVADSVIYRYQLLFHVDDDTVTPLNNVSNGYNKTSKAILTNVAFDPFGEIRYYYSTTTVTAAAAIAASAMYYSVGNVDLRYSLNISASVNALTEHKDVYMKVIPQSDGKVKLAAAFPLVQTLPTTNDGYWYIFLGRAYSTYQMSLYPHHEVYMHNGVSVVQVLPQAAVASTSMAGLMSAEDKTALENLKRAIVQTELNGFWSVSTNSLNNNNGNSVHHTRLVATEGYDRISGRTYMDSSGYAVAYFNDQLEILPEISIVGTGNVRFLESEGAALTIPSTASYVSVSGWGSATDYPIEFISDTAKALPARVDALEQELNATQKLVRKKVSVTIPAGVTSYIYTDSWVTEDADCYANDLGTLGVATTVSWVFGPGSVTFTLGEALSSALTFTFGMIQTAEPGDTTQASVSRKKITVTFPANTEADIWWAISDDWITADTDCYEHDMATRGITETIEWTFASGSVSFRFGTSPVNDVTFSFGMIK